MVSKTARQTPSSVALSTRPAPKHLLLCLGFRAYLLCCRFTAWLGANSSYGKQRRLLGELHTRMLSSGSIATDRMGLRLHYLPTLRHTLLAPLISREKEGIPEVGVMAGHA